VAGSAARVIIFPASFRFSRPSAPRTWGVFVNLVNDNTNHGAWREFDIAPVSLGALRAHGIALLQEGYIGGARLTGFRVQPGVIIVPDGVAKVTVETVISPRSSASISGGVVPAPSLRVLENVTAVVHDNVATVWLRAPTWIGGDYHLPPRVVKTWTSFGFSDGAVLRMTWLDAHGKVIRHTTTTYANGDEG
jgi:hypothetical protein